MRTRRQGRSTITRSPMDMDTKNLPHTHLRVTPKSKPKREASHSFQDHPPLHRPRTRPRMKGRRTSALPFPFWYDRLTISRPPLPVRDETFPARRGPHALWVLLILVLALRGAPDDAACVYTTRYTRSHAVNGRCATPDNPHLERCHLTFSGTRDRTVIVAISVDKPTRRCIAKHTNPNITSRNSKKEHHHEG
jgi:hypothetical protein